MKQSDYTIISNVASGGAIAFNSITCTTLYIAQENLNEFKCMCEGHTPMISDPLVQAVYNTIMQQMKRGRILVEDVVGEYKFILNRYAYNREIGTGEIELAIILSPGNTTLCGINIANASPQTLTRLGMQNIITCLLDRTYHPTNRKLKIRLKWIDPTLDKNMELLLELQMLIKHHCTKHPYELETVLVVPENSIGFCIKKTLTSQETSLHQIKIVLNPVDSSDDDIRKRLDRIMSLKAHTATCYANSSVHIVIPAIMLRTKYKRVLSRFLTLYASQYPIEPCVWELEQSIVCQKIIRKDYDIPVLEYADGELNFAKMTHHFMRGNKQALYSSPRLMPCNYFEGDFYIIDSAMNIYKCWEKIGDVKYSLGNINETHLSDVFQSSRHSLTKKRIPNNCSKCDVFPLCLGGCPFENEDCLTVKHNLREWLSWYYLN